LAFLLSPFSSLLHAKDPSHLAKQGSQVSGEARESLAFFSAPSPAEEPGYLTKEGHWV